jgi:hypothetical protein
MLRIVCATTNDRPIVETGKPLFQLIPDAVDAYGFRGKGTPSALSYEEEPFIW